MTSPSNITADERSALHEQIERKLDLIGIESEPKVAAKVLELVQDPESQVADYGAVIRNDWSLTGRLLKLVNSAHFAQRTAVTTLERALVLLGLQRVKSVSMGFYLSRAAASDRSRAFSKRIWGESVFRACLVSALVREVREEVAAEGFVVGLMLDCGVPLMPRMLGEAYEPLYAEAGGDPMRLFELETARLPFTHADVAAVLCRRWRLPAVLAEPIAGHHRAIAAAASAGIGAQAGDAEVLGCAAACAGSLALGGGGDDSAAGDVRWEESVVARLLGARALGLDDSAAAAAVRAAAAEYRAISDLFADLASPVADLDLILDIVHRALVEEMDDQLVRLMRQEAIEATGRVQIGGQELEFEPGKDGAVSVFVTSGGERLMSYRVTPDGESIASLRRRLGLEGAADREVADLLDLLRSLRE